VTDQPGADLGCELTVRREGSRLALAFVLSNRTSAQRTIRYFHPFLQFELKAIADSRERVISQPDLDIPVQPQELHVPAGGRASLDTPIRLRFASDLDAGDDAMVWTIAGEPGPLELHATLRLDGVSVPPCVART
jgi:hypothetical protein